MLGKSSATINLLPERFQRPGNNITKALIQHNKILKGQSAWQT
jgi:hypothetical protein